MLAFFVSVFDCNFAYIRLHEAVFNTEEMCERLIPIVWDYRDIAAKWKLNLIAETDEGY